MSQTKAQLISDLVQALNFTGTASAPANGAFLSAANTLALATNSAQRLTIDSSGNVGIGTTSPDGLLHVLSGSAGSVTAATDANDVVLEASTNVGISLLTANDSQARIKFGDPDANNAGSLIYNHQNDKLSIVTATGNRMIIGSDMISARTSYGILRTTGGYTFRETNEGNERAGIHSNSSNDLIFKTASAAEKMRIQANGLIGIGTTSPSAALELVASTTGRSYSVSSATEFVVERNGNSQISIIAANDSDSIIHFADTDDENIGLIGYDHANNSMRFRTNDSVYMTLDSSGKLGIGTTSPSAKLHVIEDIYAKGSSGDGSVGIQIRSGGSALSNQHQIRTGGGTGEQLFIEALGSSSALVTKVNGSERMRIDSSGRLLLGTTTEGEGDADDFTIAGSGNTGITIRSGTSNDGAIFFSDGTSGNAEFEGTIQYLHSSNAMTFKTNHAERVRIDSAGRVGINQTSFATSDTMLSISELTGHLEVGLLSKNDSACVINFGDPDNYNIGRIKYANDDNSMRFDANDAERMRIDSSGNVGIGTSSTSMNGNGLKIYHTNFPSLQLQNNATGTGATVGAEFILSSGGALQLVQRSAEAMIFKTTNIERMRINNAGIVGINNDGTAFGQLCVGMPSQSGGSAIQVMNSASGSGDNTLTNIILRSVNNIANNWSHAQYRASSHQFQYQSTTKVNINSNGLCFNSDTAAANALDDYEEGTFTPSLVQGYNNVSYNAQAGFYTKIGRFVSYSIYLYVASAGGDNAEIRISLPFTTVNTQYLEEGAYIVYDSNFLSSSNDEKSNCYIQSGRNYTYLRLFKNTNGASIFGNDTLLGTGANNVYLLLKGFLTTS